MPYSIYTPSGCDVLVGDHFCSVCPVVEGGRVRSVVFIKNTVALIDPSDPTEWDTLIANKDVIIIPATNGSFDGGSEKEGPGYGDQATKLLGYDFQLTYNDPDYKLNGPHYNEIKRSRNYRVAYRTETQIHLSTNTVSIIPKNPVADDIASEVTWNVTVKWTEEDLPVPYDTPAGIFECFQYN